MTAKPPQQQSHQGVMEIQRTPDDSTSSSTDLEKAPVAGDGGVLSSELSTPPNAPKPPPTLRDKLNKPIRFHLAFLSLLIMVFIVSIDATALAVAIPKVAEELNGTTLEAFWANISFMLTVTVVQPIYTSTSDVLGRKPPLYAAFFLFGLGSIIFAVAPSLPIVILGRSVQGLGGGGIDVLNEVIVADITTLRERAFYIGLLSIPMALGTILGPILGALFSDYVTWRWIGWINLPLIGVCLPLTIWCLKLRPMPDTFKEQLARIDWTGMGLFTVGAVLFTLPLSWAGSMYPWVSYNTLLPLFIGVAVLAVFVWYEAKPVEPMFPYRIFANRTAASTLVGSFIHGMVLYTLLSYLPLFFQSVFLEAPLQSAISILPFCAVLMSFTGIAAMGVEWTRKYLWEIWAGWVFLAVGVGLFGLWGTENDTGMRVGFQVVAAIGLGTLFTVPPIPMQASAERSEDQGLAVGILVAFRLFGALIGLAIAATAFSSQFAVSIGSLGELPEAAKILENPNEALGFIPYLREIAHEIDPVQMDEIQLAYAKALRVVFYILAAFGAVGFLASLLTKELDIESEEDGKQGFDG
ncbi:major facilitator superfamily domain-containing protein [Podospora australis]|uniref:Major facilitator superfamily domain-containing protein n=1 Tax=Podospora australis TaxID=1536484 RepID=A0AAN7ACM3_9PEZI|nr:major facilitator superfamily domain-containing protein [Podospora australis]